MGNQSTSGIVEETKATNEKPQEVISSPDELKEENQTQVQEDKTGDHFHEESEEDISEEFVNEDYETRTDVEPNESNSEEGRSKFKNEDQDEEVSCDSRGEMQNPNQECTSTITTILNSKPHEAINDITSEYQEEQSMLEKKEIEYLVVEEKENDLVAAGTPCDEGKTCPDEAECEKNDDHLEEEQSDAFSTLNDVEIIGLIESSAAEDVDQEISSECAVEIDSQCGSEKDGVLDEVKEVVESDDEEEVKEIGGSIGQEDKSILEKAVKEVIEEIAGSIAVTNDHVDESIFKEKGVLKECIKNEHEEESRVSVGFESKTPIVELKKCPSFDFGVSFDRQTGESDQTPLLYQDKTARRSVSSCANLRFETKYLAVEVQEKTIRMERSNSESITKQETVSKDDASFVSERANAKRKPRSSLFTTCICCTAAIS